PKSSFAAFSKASFFVMVIDPPKKHDQEATLFSCATNRLCYRFPLVNGKVCPVWAAFLCPSSKNRIFFSYGKKGCGTHSFPEETG
ncbi:MAG: hypothetical protein KH745_08245, partial [Bilophila sp.]|nr:hypothetical protein [Bilophila sp.]